MSRFLIKLLFFLSLVAVLQFAVGYEVPEQIEVLDEAMSGKMDVIFFCDSTNFAYDLQDTDTRSISQMLQDMMEKRQVLTINRGAYDMDVYLAYCKYIARSKSRPALAIIPINMRCFSPGWDQRPGWQSEQERFFLDFPFLRSFYKPLLVFKVVSANRISTEQYNQTNVYCDEELVGKVRDFDFTCTDPNSVTDDQIRKSCVFNYMYPLRSDHRKLRSLVEIVSVLNSIGAECLFYITPLDMATGRKHLSDKFCQRVRKNVELVKVLLRNENARLLDLSETVSSEHFAWSVYPNEHLDQHGRLSIADHLNRALQEEKDL